MNTYSKYPSNDSIVIPQAPTEPHHIILDYSIAYMADFVFRIESTHQNIPVAIKAIRMKTVITSRATDFLRPSIFCELKNNYR